MVQELAALGSKDGQLDLADQVSVTYVIWQLNLKTRLLSSFSYWQNCLDFIKMAMNIIGNFEPRIRI
jgi:hypothetical protein